MTRHIERWKHLLDIPIGFRVFHKSTIVSQTVNWSTTTSTFEDPTQRDMDEFVFRARSPIVMLHPHMEFQHVHWGIGIIRTPKGILYECIHDLPFLGDGRSASGSQSSNIEELFVAIADTHALMHELL